MKRYPVNPRVARRNSLQRSRAKGKEKNVNGIFHTWYSGIWVKNSLGIIVGSVGSRCIIFMTVAIEEGS
jgi:hypothetical protein